MSEEISKDSSFKDFFDTPMSLEEDKKTAVQEIKEGIESFSENQNISKKTIRTAFKNYLEIIVKSQSSR